MTSFENSDNPSANTESNFGLKNNNKRRFEQAIKGSDTKRMRKVLNTSQNILQWGDKRQYGGW